MRKALGFLFILTLMSTPAHPMFKRLTKLANERNVARVCFNLIQSSTLTRQSHRREQWPTMKYGKQRMCEVIPESKFCREEYWPYIETFTEDLTYALSPAAEFESPTCAARVFLHEITAREFRKCVEDEKAALNDSNE